MICIRLKCLIEAAKEHDDHDHEEEAKKKKKEKKKLENHSSEWHSECLFLKAKVDVEEKRLPSVTACWW